MPLRRQAPLLSESAAAASRGRRCRSVLHAWLLKVSRTTPRPPPPGGVAEAAEAVSALELPSESCALGRGALAQGFPPHGDVFSVTGGGHWGHGALGVAGGSCEALAGCRRLARVKAARLGHPHPPPRTE